MKRVCTLCVFGWLAMGVACIPSQGGWDDSVISAAFPELDEIEGHRLGDLIPYPALVGEELVLVACRFPTGSRLRVVGSGVAWSPDWAGIAIRALDRSLSGIDLELVPETRSSTGTIAENAERLTRTGVLEPKTPPGARESAAESHPIEILSVLGGGESSPVGLGDTLAECDVAEDGQGRIRGWIMRAGIRIRRSRPDGFGQVEAATEEEWIAALLHEMGHALGFPSHIAKRDSLMGIDTAGLRAAARHAIEEEPLPTADLEALYALPPGLVLGHPVVAERMRHWVRQVLRTVAIETEKRGPPVGPIALVGDDSARLVWRWPESADGNRSLAIHFPAYRRQISEREPLRGVAVVPRRK